MAGEGRNNGIEIEEGSVKIENEIKGRKGCECRKSVCGDIGTKSQPSHPRLMRNTQNRKGEKPEARSIHSRYKAMKLASSIKVQM